MIIVSPIWMVSILVLLDVALKGQGHQCSVRGLKSFNPCSLGCCSERAAMLMIVEYSYRVSILVLLDVALKGVVAVLVNVMQRSFQSLFSWMLL